MARICALIPAFDEAQRLPPVVAGALQWADLVLVVDDGSRDGTGEAARKAGARVLVHPANKGKGAALKTGFEAALAADMSAVVTLDADGQHNPQEAPLLIRQAQWLDADLVVGRRNFRQNMPRIRRMTNRLMTRILSWYAGCPIEDSQSGFRYYHSRLLRRLNLNTSRFDAESEILVRAGRLGAVIASAPVSTIYLDGRISHIHPVKDTLRFLRLCGRLAFE